MPHRCLLASIALFSLAAGAMIGGVYSGLGLSVGAVAGHQHDHGFGPVSVISGVFLGLLLAFHAQALLRRRLRRV